MSAPPPAPGSPPRAVRVLIGAHLFLGAWLLLAPDALLGELSRERIDRGVRVFARVLGARHLVEAAALERHHTHDWLRAGAAVDATHALTMIVLAWLVPARRRLAMTNAASAATLACCTFHFDRRGDPAGAG